MKTFLKLFLALGFIYVITGCNNNSSTKTTSGDTAISHGELTHDSTGNNEEHMDNAHMNSMKNMMDNMSKMDITGDFDIDFANMMIMHHEAAVNMSQEELKSGKNDSLKAIAQRIINKQKSEITQLRDFVKDYKPSGMKHGEGELKKSMSEMEAKMKSMTLSGDADKDFASMMIEHHKEAISMGKMEQKHGMSAKLKQMAAKMIQDQNKEVKELSVVVR